MSDLEASVPEMVARVCESDKEQSHEDAEAANTERCNFSVQEQSSNSAATAQTSSASATVLTDEMIQEEEKLHQKSEKEERKLKDEMEEQWRQDTAKLRELRFQRLQFLLQKSNLYTSYLLTRMQRQKEEEHQRDEKRRKRLQKKLEMSRQHRGTGESGGDSIEEKNKENMTPLKEQRNLSTNGESSDAAQNTKRSISKMQENSTENSTLNISTPATSKTTETSTTIASTPTSDKMKAGKRSSPRTTQNTDTDSKTKIEEVERSIRRRSSRNSSRPSSPGVSTTIGKNESETRAPLQECGPSTSRYSPQKFSSKTSVSTANKVTKSRPQTPTTPNVSMNELSSATDSQDSTGENTRRSSRIRSRAATPVTTTTGAAGKSSERGKCSQGEPKRGKKRKLGDSYNIADYFQEALSRAKKAHQEQEDFELGEIKGSRDSPTTEEEMEATESVDHHSSTGEDPNSSKIEATSDKEESQKESQNESQDSQTDSQKEQDLNSVGGCRLINGEVVPDGQPVLFTGGILRDYQIEGFKWLKIIYENGINGILADEMGLGKTIQCIALLSHIIYHGIQGPFLVCAPLSTVPNWVSEFNRFSPKIPVILYHGNKQERQVLRRKINKVQRGIYGDDTACCPVVVTSYEIVMNDRAHMQNYQWKFIIVDEGHRLKNFQCKLIRELKLYRSTHRLLLTGTPLQNNLSELWSLLNFLLPEIFDDLSSFEMWFDIDNLEKSDAHNEIVKEEQKKSVITMLHQILNPFMLRRMKTDVELSVPPKREVLVYAPMSRRQQELHMAIRDRTIRQVVNKTQEEVKPEIDHKGRPKRNAKKLFDKDAMVTMMNDSSDDVSEAKFDKWLEGASVSKMFEDNYSSYKEVLPQTSEVNIKLNNVMMLLRKCTNHPYLLEYPLTPQGQFKVDEELVRSSGKLLWMDCMLRELKARNHKVLLFSQMTKLLDILEDYCYHRKFAYCRLDGSMKVDERKEQIDSFNEDPDVFIFLLSTRAGGLGLNLVAADTVIIFDSDWNPQNDLQAQDRCHRIGQKRPVMVYRLVTAATIDQKIVERAAAKRKLEKMIIHKGRFKDASIERLTAKLTPLKPDELIELLQSVDYDDVITGKRDQVMSKSDLDSLLDRSDLWAAMKQRNQDSDNNNAKCRDSVPENDELIDDLVKEVESENESKEKKKKKLFKIVDEDKADTVVC